MRRASCCSASPTGWTCRCSLRAAPFDLIVANILAGPLIELAPDFAAALAPGGTVVLAGLLDSQADGVIAAYAAVGVSLVDRGFGEWPVVVCERPA